ncbi:uncharacterized protein [Scyliorhinus torazame]|uniref:Uncharacterized protein n=1 Tax=Scyliorhinus torazame TaxID=75743 RepID=A0A401PR84_SCYTO|nr:hypothetical protein [Scyliorhinus torazame]
MSLSSADILVGFTINETDRHKGLDDAVLGLKIMDLTIASIALCILVVSGIICSLLYHRRRRRLQRARLYETTIKTTSNVKRVKRRQGFGKSSIFTRKQENKHSTKIFFIYQNPTMASSEECIMTI